MLGVDTDVALDGRLLGKPADDAGARERLEALSGRTHEVLSGVVALGTAIGGGVPVERSAIATHRGHLRASSTRRTIDLYRRLGRVARPRRRATRSRVSDRS